MMADPLTLATSVASLISLTLQVATLTTDFANYTSDAIRGPKSLFSELKALSSVLEQLEALLTAQTSCLTFTKTSVLFVANEGCRKELGILLEKLKKHGSVRKDGTDGGKVRYVLRRIQWPLQARETRDAVEGIHRYVEVFMFALNIEGCDLLSRTFSALNEAQPKTSRDLKDILGAVRELPEFKQGLDSLSGQVKGLEISSKEQADRDSKRRDLETRKTLLNKICPTTPHQRHNDAKSEYEQGTCQWYIADPRFQSWETGTSSPILWGPGVPGAGKTILSSFIIDHLKHTQKHAHVAYLYCDYQDATQASAVNLLSSITRQLAETDADIFARIAGFWDDSCDKQYFTGPSFNHRWNDSALRHISDVPDIFIVVDAVDEIPEHTERGEDTRALFMGSLRRLALVGNYRIFVTSRSHLDVEMLVGGCVKLEIEPPRSDIRALVDSRFSTSARLNRILDGDEALKAKFAEALVEASGGMFLMARLTLNQITSVVNVGQIYDVLEKLPNQLYGFYDEQIRRLRSLPFYERALCMRVLSWVFACKRPLSARELVEGLAVEAGDTNIESSRITKTTIILELCAGFIHLTGQHRSTPRDGLPERVRGEIVGDQQVRFVHSTVQDYFTEYHEGIFNTNPDRDIFRACATYIALPEIQESASSRARLTVKYPFLSYAVNFWPAHVSAAMSDEDHTAMGRIMKVHADQTESLTLSASDPGQNFNPLWLLWTDPDISDSSSILCQWGNLRYTQQLLSACPGIISLAALLHHQNDYALRWLLSNEWDPLVLQFAVAEDIPMLDVLLDRITETGVSLDQYDHTKDYIYPPMIQAINMSNRSLVRKLLDSNSDPNSRWRPGEYHGTQTHLLTPLEAAVQQSWKPVVEMLVHAGADPHLPGGRFGTAMQIAKRIGEVEVMRVLNEASNDDDWEIVKRGTSKILDRTHFIRLREWKSVVQETVAVHFSRTQKS